MKRKPVPLYVVAFGTEWPEEFSTSAQAFEYLNSKYDQHDRGCFSVDGPAGNWSQFAVREIWWALCENPEKFELYYRMVADQSCVPS